ncbi:hypothetical protein ACIBKY_28570 [Nonomuraea sp. NPDC050394]|uniref:hypothetical protein n=1 Tax=Nonomuraea sp. NPDC050394 TaxID=3364363 RepID=UPI003789E630
MATSRILDCFAISDLASGKAKYVEAVIQLSSHIQLIVPAVSLVAGLSRIEDGEYGAVKALMNLPATSLIDTSDTVDTIIMLARKGHLKPPHRSIIAAIVGDAGKRYNAPVLTSDPGPLQRLWPEGLVDAYVLR